LPIFATGVSYRMLDVPGCSDLHGRGVFYGSAATEAANCTGQEIYIVGGANSAGQAAMYFSRYASTVHILVRGEDLQRSMSQYLVDQIESTGNIVVHPFTEVCRGEGDEHLEQLTLLDTRTGQTRTVATSWLFIFIGAEPRTDWLDGVVARDERGFVLTGPDLLVGGERPTGWSLPRDPYHLESSVPGIFAAGDVRADSVKRVASAVGEGAMAISLVHRYLETQ
ncbi:MAG TPA: fused response regulator/thioredoxin-disulfide reductase, partial [Micromonosporaceae bacterium]|nr:fused response regulator/thioredoxin-disulfide reductase [Micromonosporaceae bacterium]